MNIKKKEICLTANEFVCSFLSQNFEKSPWVLKNIEKTENFLQFNILDFFDIETSRLKSAVDYLNDYRVHDDYQVFNFEQENAKNASNIENLTLLDFQAESETNQISIQKYDSSDTSFSGDELSIKEEALDLRHVYIKNAPLL